MVDQQLWKAGKFLQAAPVCVPAGHQRRPGRHRRCWARSAWRWTPSARVEGVFAHVVRQGAGRGPQRATRSSTATSTAARRAACWWWRRRPRLRLQLHAAPERPGLQAWHMPVLHPGNVAEYLEFGLYGWALSPLFSGNWVGFKAISEVVEIGMTVDLDAVPLDFEHPVRLHAGQPAALSAGRTCPALQLEERVQPSWRCGACVRPAQLGGQAHRRARRRPRWASSPWARRTSTSWRCCAASTSTRMRWPRPACASTRWAWSIRSSRRACWPSPRG
jgi:indolepyruvate ferredoxin oxidoreductase